MSSSDVNIQAEYVYAVMGRAGLGNMLFPWARAHALAQDSGMEVILPHWWRPRLGPYLRRERDKRQYQRILRQPPLKDVLRNMVVRQSSTIVDETGHYVRRRGASRPTVLIVEGMGGYFGPLMRHQSLVAAEFRTLVGGFGDKSKLLSRRYAAIHIRLGDFARPEKSGHSRNTSSPVIWFRDQALALSELVPDWEIVVCSDGTDEELKPILEIPSVRRDLSANAVQDLITLANSDLIIGSGSTFSSWGAFLGQVPMIVDAGKNFYLPGAKQVLELSSPVGRAELAHIASKRD